MKIDGREVRDHEVCIIATTPGIATHPPDKLVFLMPCANCGVLLAVDGSSIPLVMRGITLACLPCAASYHPDMIAGRDPDTGRHLTLREILDQPNSVGAYRHQDIKEIE